MLQPLQPPLLHHLQVARSHPRLSRRQRTRVTARTQRRRETRNPSGADDGGEESRTPESPSGYSLDEAIKRRGRLDVYENSLTGERRHGHPGVPLIFNVVKGMQQRKIQL